MNRHHPPSFTTRFLIGLLLMLALPWAAMAQIAPARFRAALTGAVAADGLGRLLITQGDSLDLAVALFESDGTTLVDVDGLVDLTLELYASADSTTQISEPITLTSEDLDATLTNNEWTAGTGQHAIFELGPEQTNITMLARQQTLWGVIYGTLPDGQRRTFGAGTITLRRGNAGGASAPDPLDPLYPTLSQITAFQTLASAASAAVTAETAARIAGDLALTLPPPLALQDDTRPLYIVPVMRQFGTGGSEALGLWYSRDGLTFSDLYSGNLYTGTVADDVRDPSLVIRKDAWYVAYTAGSFGQVTYFGLAKSTDQGKTWAFHGNIECVGSVGATWGPSFFTDPATGQLYIYISFSTGGGNHKGHVMRCLSDDLLTWEAPVALTGAKASEVYDIDIRTAYASGFYYQIASVGSKSPGGGAASGPAIYRSRSVVGPWTLISSPYAQWHSGAAAALEQTNITYLGADRWQANFTKVTPGSPGGVWVSFSNDNLLTWSAPVQVTSNPTTPHNFSEWVYMPAKSAGQGLPLPRLLSTVSATTAPAATDLPAGRAAIWDNSTTGGLTLTANQGGTLRSIRLGGAPVTYTAPAGAGVNLTTNIDLTPVSMGWPYAEGAAATAYKVIVSTAQPTLYYQEFLVRGGAAGGGAGATFDSGLHSSLTLISAEANDYFDAALSVPGSTGPLRVAVTNKIKDANAWTINVQVVIADP